MKSIFSILIGLMAFSSYSQELTSVIRGTITDKVSQSTLTGVNVVLVGSDPMIGTTTDVNGDFRLENVPVGRQVLKVSFIGYETREIPNLLVLSAKDLQLNIQLNEQYSELGEVVISGEADKRESINKMNTVSSRTISIEEATRFSGSLQDPARMSQNYAGVSGSSDDRNDIIIRGNSPTGVLWRLEGVDIPSPNHFSTIGTTGGPISMLNVNNLKNSEFMTGAWASEYGNAMSGVFDLQLRDGNNDSYEHLFQVGVNGFELGSEGPFKKGGRASYMFNY
ncbi:MAG: carboxypeptidase-like regulatory domain-containing protein, partial [Flavobacteriales bacterium]